MVSPAKAGLFLLIFSVLRSFSAANKHGLVNIFNDNLTLRPLHFLETDSYLYRKYKQTHTMYHTNHPITGKFIEVEKLATYPSKRRAQQHANAVTDAFIEESRAISNYGYWNVFCPKKTK